MANKNPRRMMLSMAELVARYCLFVGRVCPRHTLYNQSNCRASMYTHTSVTSGPPQIISADFHASARTTSCWLSQEMKNAGSCAPFINAVFGFKSNSAGEVAALTYAL